MWCLRIAQRVLGIADAVNSIFDSACSGLHRALSAGALCREVQRTGEAKHATAAAAPEGDDFADFWRLRDERVRDARASALATRWPSLIVRNARPGQRLGA